MGKRINFFVTTLLMAIIFVGLITFIFDTTGWKFYLEFLILLGLFLFAFLSLILVFAGISAGYVLSAGISLLALVYFIFMYFRTSLSTLLFSVAVASITAFIVSVVNLGSKEKEITAEPEKKPVIKTYTPGKVVSSKTAAYYHVPTCDWAKKIKKSNQVWYDTDEDAKKAGLKPHSCIE